MRLVSFKNVLANLLDKSSHFLESWFRKKNYSEKRISNLLNYKSFFLENEETHVVGKLTKFNETWVLLSFDGEDFHLIYDKEKGTYPSPFFQQAITQYLDSLEPYNISFKALPNVFGQNFEKLHSLKHRLVKENLLCETSEKITLFSMSRDEFFTLTVEAIAFSGPLRSYSLELYLQHKHYQEPSLLESYPAFKYLAGFATMSAGLYGLSSNKLPLPLEISLASSLALTIQHPLVLLPSILSRLPITMAEFDCNLIRQRSLIESKQFLCSAEAIVGNASKITTMVNTFETVVVPSGIFSCNDMRNDGNPDCSGLYQALLNCNINQLLAANIIINRANQGIQRCYFFYEDAIASIAYADNLFTQLTLALSSLQQNTTQSVNIIGQSIHNLLGSLNNTAATVSTISNDVLMLGQKSVNTVVRVSQIEEDLSRTKEGQTATNQSISTFTLLMSIAALFILIKDGLGFLLKIKEGVVILLFHGSKIDYYLKNLEVNIEKIKLRHDLLLVLTENKSQPFLSKTCKNEPAREIHYIYRKLYYNSRIAGLSVHLWDKYRHNLKDKLSLTKDHNAYISEVLAQFEETFLLDDSHSNSFQRFKATLPSYDKAIHELMLFFQLPESKDAHKINLIMRILNDELIPLIKIIDTEFKNLLKAYRIIINFSVPVAIDIKKREENTRPQQLIETAVKQARAAFLVFEERFELLEETKAKIINLLSKITKKKPTDFEANTIEAQEKEAVVKDAEVVLTELHEDIETFMIMLGLNPKTKLFDNYSNKSRINTNQESYFGPDTRTSSDSHPPFINERNFSGTSDSRLLLSHHSSSLQEEVTLKQAQEASLLSSESSKLKDSKQKALFDNLAEPPTILPVEIPKSSDIKESRCPSSNSLDSDNSVSDISSISDEVLTEANEEMNTKNFFTLQSQSNIVGKPLFEQHYEDDIPFDVFTQENHPQFQHEKNNPFSPFSGLGLSRTEESNPLLGLPSSQISPPISNTPLETASSTRVKNQVVPVNQAGASLAKPPQEKNIQKAYSVLPDEPNLTTQALPRIGTKGIIQQEDGSTNMSTFELAKDKHSVEPINQASESDYFTHNQDPFVRRFLKKLSQNRKSTEEPTINKPSKQVTSSQATALNPLLAFHEETEDQSDETAEQLNTLGRQNYWRRKETAEDLGTISANSTIISKPKPNAFSLQRLASSHSNGSLRGLAGSSRFFARRSSFYGTNLQKSLSPKELELFESYFDKINQFKKTVSYLKNYEPAKSQYLLENFKDDLNDFRKIVEEISSLYHTTTSTQYFMNKVQIGLAFAEHLLRLLDVHHFSPSPI